MGIRILHSADWHLESPFQGFSQEQRDCLRQHQMRLPRQVLALAQEKNCDLILLAGDVFDREPSRDTVDDLKEQLAEAAIPVFIAPGNHDFCGPGSPWTETAWPENVHIFREGLESVCLPELDCRIYGAGYRSMDCPPLLEGFRAEGNERYKLAVLHGDPVGSRSPYCPVTAAQIRESGLDYLALGHIHAAGSLRSGQTLCGWPGTPMGRGWDETGEKGVYIVELEESAQILPVLLDTPRFYELEAEVETDAAALLEARLPAAGSGDFYRIRLTGWAEVDVPGLYRQFARFPNLTLRDETESPAELWAEAGEDTLRGVYFQALQQLAQTDPKARLAAQISRNLLAGREVSLP